MERFTHSYTETAHAQDNERIERGIKARGSVFETLRKLRLPILSYALVGCAAPVGMAAEQNAMYEKKQEVEEKNADAKTTDAVSNLIEQFLFPDVEWKFTEQEKEAILSSPLAGEIRGLTEFFTPKQIKNILNELPQIYTKETVDGKETFTPSFGARLLSDLSAGNISVHFEMPPQKELEERGLTADMLKASVLNDASREWSVRYGRIPVQSENKKTAHIRCTYIASDGINEFNEIERSKPVYATARISPLIGRYNDNTDREILLPAIAPSKMYWAPTGFAGNTAGIPENVLMKQYGMEQGKMFQYFFLNHGVFGKRNSADKYDVGYGAVQVYVFQTDDELKRMKGVAVERGSDGKEYVIAPRNSDSETDPSNLLVRALMKIVSKDGFEKKKNTDVKKI